MLHFHYWCVAVPHYSISQEIDIICFCSVCVTITTLKLHCFNFLRRMKFSLYSVCLCECGRTQPISLSDKLLSVSGGRVSAPMPDAYINGNRREGALPPPYMEVQEFPPRQGIPSPCDSRSAHTTGKLWASRERGGEGGEGRSHNHHRRLSDATHLVNTNPFFHFTHAPMHHMLAKQCICSLSQGVTVNSGNISSVTT